MREKAHGLYGTGLPEVSAQACSGVKSEETPEGFSDPMAESARQVILTMSRLGIPLSPENYWVWFDHVSGSNQKLSQEIEVHLKKGATFTDSLNRQLYDRHVGPWRDAKVMEEVSQELESILKESMGKIVSTGSVTKDYSLKLKDFLGSLEEKGRHASSLREMIVGLILETRRMEQSSSELREQLEKSESESSELRNRLIRMEREATLDVLTGIYNRKYMEKELSALYEDYTKKGMPFSVIMIDLDHFKIVNDTYGHKVGDAVLQFVGSVVKGTVKGRDIPARYGGEEFVILLPMTSCGNACKVAEQLRQEICRKPLTIRQTGESIGMVSVSAGVAEVRDGDSKDTLLERADQAMYLAKGQGRNNVKSEAELAG